MALTTVQQAMVNPNPSTQTFGFKNRLINGGMVIDQRNAGASVTNNTTWQYTLDRWAIYGSVSSKFTCQQSTTAPSGFINSLLITSSSAYSVGAGDQFILKQIIEGYNIADLAFASASASPITLSFWVRSSLTGTFSGAIKNGGGGSTRSYVFSYTINSANTWEQKSVTIAGDTGGTYFTNNQSGLLLWLDLGSGSTYRTTAGSWVNGDYQGATGSQSLVGTNGATFYITGVQLESGSTATGFDFRSYGTEFALCQRYYAKMTGSSGGYCAFGSGRITSATNGDIFIKFPTTLRAAPTITASSTAVDCNVFVATTTMSASYVGFDSALCSFTMASGGATTGQGATLIANNNTAAFIALNSEL